MTQEIAFCDGFKVIKSELGEYDYTLTDEYETVMFHFNKREKHSLELLLRRIPDSF